MNKIYIVEFGYHKIAVPSKELALELLDCKLVDYEYNAKIYTPQETEVSVKVVDSSLIRLLNDTEKENKEISELKSSKAWHESQNKDLKKEIEELKCQLKVAADASDKKGESNDVI